MLLSRDIFKFERGSPSVKQNELSERREQRHLLITNNLDCVFELELSHVARSCDRTVANLGRKKKTQVDSATQREEKTISVQRSARIRIS